MMEIEPTKTKQKKPRLLYLDIVRLFACLCILTIHFNASVSGYDYSGTFLYDNGIVPNTFFSGVYLGDIGVVLFFILSGASLEYTNPKGCGKIWTFYRKRVKNIYPQYWIAFSIFTLLSFWVYRGMTNAPLSHLLVSLLGMDGYVMSLGGNACSFYQCGEWFLGCILCLYVIFPLLSWCFHKKPILTCLLTAGIYMVAIKQVPERWFFLRIPELLLGMYFIRYIKTAKNARIWIVAILLAIVRIFFRKYLSTLTVAIITCWILFLLITLFVELLSTKITVSENIYKVIVYGSNLTYPLFLVHHKIIAMMAMRFDLSYFPYRYTLVLYIIYLLVSIGAAIGLEYLETKLSGFICRGTATK